MVQAQEALIKSVRDSECVKELTEGKPHLEFFCDDECILRFLRARGMDVKKASTMLTDTLKWREEQKMHEITFTDVEDFAKNGKVILGPSMSRCGRPVLILRTRMEDKANAWDMNIKHFAYQMEMVSRLANKESPDGKIVVIIDYVGWTMAKRAPMKVSLAVLKILQYYYPERLHQCFWWHAPAMFNTIYKLIKPFVDPVTAKKIVMLPKHDETAQEQLNETVDTNQLDDTQGGSTPDIYDFNVWRARLLEIEATYVADFEAFQGKGKVA